MKSILVPVDFSSFSKDALDAAIDIAKIIHADIHILHVVTEFSDIVSNSFQSDIKESLKLNIGAWAKELLLELKSKVEDENIKCSIKCSYGHLITEIENVLREEHYELIIMGSHGASGKEEWFIGSNAQKVIRRLHKNVMVIKQPIADLKFSKVVYVTGLNQEDKNTFEGFLNFLTPFNVEEIHVLTINTLGILNISKDVSKQSLKEFKNIGDKQNITTHFYNDFTVEAGVKHFTEEFDIDLIGISNIEKHPVKRIFLGSNVEMIVNHSRVPVLSLDHK